MAIYEVGGLRSDVSQGRITMTLTSRSGYATFSISALVLPRLTVYCGPTKVVACGWSYTRGLDLAHLDFSSSDPIELLLGAKVYARVLWPGLRQGGDAQQTALGWIVLGPVNSCRVTVSSTQCLAAEDLSAVVRRFWELEEAPQASLPLTPDDAACKKHYARTHLRDASERYVV